MMAEKALRNLTPEQSADGSMELKALEAMLDGLWDSKKNPIEISCEVPVGVEVPWHVAEILPNGPDPAAGDSLPKLEARTQEAEAKLENCASTADWFGAAEAAREHTRAQVAQRRGERPTVKKLRRGFQQAGSKLSLHCADLCAKQKALLAQSAGPVRYHDVAALGDDIARVEKEMAAALHCKLGGKVMHSM